MCECISVKGYSTEHYNIVTLNLVTRATKPYRREVQLLSWAQSSMHLWPRIITKSNVVETTLKAGFTCALNCVQASSILEAILFGFRSFAMVPAESN